MVLGQLDRHMGKNYHCLYIVSYTNQSLIDFWSKYKRNTIKFLENNTRTYFNDLGIAKVILKRKYTHTKALNIKENW